MGYLRIGLHIIIVILVTTKVLIWNASKATYVRSLQQTFEFLFTDPILDVPGLQRVDLFSYNETFRYVDLILDKYGRMNNLSTSEFSYGTELIDGSRNCVSYVPPIQWTSCLWTSSSNVDCTESMVDNYTDYPIAIFGQESYYSHLDSFQLTFDLCNYVNTFGANHDCHYWRIDITFRSVSLLYLQAIVKSTLVDECEQAKTSLSIVQRPSNWLNIFTIIFCAFYSIFVFYDILESIRIYRAVKEAHQKAHLAYLDKRAGEFLEHELASMYSWDQIPRGVKRSFHNYWSIFTLAAITLAIIQAGISLSDPYDDLENLVNSQKALVGISVFFVWMSIVQFIPVQSPVYAVAATIQTAFPRIFAFMLSFIPVFLAFVFFGMALFGSELGSFGSVERSAKFIFALMAGDSVMQIMQLMTRRSIWASLIFGISFTLVTAYLLINIFIAIVEEAYFMARKQGRYLELLMWRNLRNIARSKHPNPGSMEDFDADVATLVIQPSATSNQSASLLVQLQELERFSPTRDPQSSNSAGITHSKSASSPLPPTSQHVIRAQERLRETLAEQHQNRNYQVLVKELLEATIPESQLAERQGLNPDALTITLAEETAEMYILGRNHWEYSKMMDYIAEQLDMDSKRS